MTKRIPPSMLIIKVGLLAITTLIFYVVSSPYPVCWEPGQEPTANVTLDDASMKKLSVESEANETGLCVKTILFDNFMCAGDPWKNPWWSVKLTNPLNFCIARTSTYSAIVTQLALIVAIQVLHLFFLMKRSFANYDPLDIIPAFFTICALSSVLIIQRVLASTWEDLWIYNKLNVSSSPLPHTFLDCIIFAGILLSVVDWIVYHKKYNAEQDQIEECAKSNVTGLFASDNKQHGD